MYLPNKWMNISAILKLCDLELGSFLDLSDPVSEIERVTDLRERERLEITG